MLSLGLDAVVERQESDVSPDERSRTAADHTDHLQLLHVVLAEEYWLLREHLPEDTSEKQMPSRVTLLQTSE